MKILFALPVVALMLFGCKKVQTQQANDEECGGRRREKTGRTPQ